MSGAIHLQCTTGLQNRLCSALLPQFLIPPGPEALTHAISKAKIALGDESAGVWRGRLERKGIMPSAFPSPSPTPCNATLALLNLNL